MPNRLDDLGLILAKAKDAGFFPDVKEYEADALAVRARELYKDDPFLDPLGAINVKTFGAKGDGVTDDTKAIKAAIDAANFIGFGTVYIPAGKYWIGTWSTFVAAGSATFPRYCFKVGNNVNIVSDPGAQLLYSTDYNTRRVMFYLEGSKINIKGITVIDTYDMIGGSRPTGIPIACGNAYEATSTTDCNDITIRDCSFYRPWHPTKWGFDGTVKSRNIEISGCVSYAEPTSTSSGGYNFRSYPGGISEVTVTKNRCYDVTVSAAVGFYGTWRATASTNILVGSQIDGGGVQCENGARNFTIDNNILINHFNAAWADDSSKGQITNNICLNTTVNSQNKGVRITKQGFTEEPDKLVTDIIVANNTLTNCYIAMESFGTPAGSPTFGVFNFAHNNVYLDGVTNAYGFNILQAKSTTYIGNYVEGALTYCYRLTHDPNQSVTFTGNTSAKSAANEASGSVTFTNTNAFRPIVANNNLHVPPVIAQATCMRIGSNWFWEGTGTPEGAVSSPVGSTYSRRDGTAGATFYVKETGTTATGWVAK